MSDYKGVATAEALAPDSHAVHLPARIDGHADVLPRRLPVDFVGFLNEDDDELRRVLTPPKPHDATGRALPIALMDYLYVAEAPIERRRLVDVTNL